MILFTVAQLTNSATRMSGYLLMMTDHQYLTMFNQLFSGVLNVVLNYIFIINFGFLGAAIATASVLTIINVFRVAQVWYHEEIHPCNLSFFKLFIAGVVSTAVMYLISLIFARYALLIIGGLCGAVSFFGVLILFGFETEEKIIFNELYTNLLT